MPRASPTGYARRQARACLGHAHGMHRQACPSTMPFGLHAALATAGPTGSHSRVRVWHSTRKPVGLPRHVRGDCLQFWHARACMPHRRPFGACQWQPQNLLAASGPTRWHGPPRLAVLACKSATRPTQWAARGHALGLDVPWNMPLADPTMSHSGVSEHASCPKPATARVQGI